MFPFFRSFHVLFDGEPAAGGGVDPGGSPPAATPLPAPASTTPAEGTAPVVPATSTPGAERFSYDEDRSAYLSPEKVNSIIRDRVGRVASDRDRYRAMMEAGTGVKGADTPEPMSREEQEAKGTILKLLGISGEELEFLKTKRGDLSNLLEQAPEMANSQQTAWTAHGARMLNSLHTGIAEAIGADKLSDFQAQTIGQSYVAWLRSNEQLQARYSWGDPALSTEFVALWKQGFVDPSRRVAQAPDAATAAANRKLPASPQPSGVVPGAAPAGEKKTEDEALEGGWQSMLARQKAASAL